MKLVCKDCGALFDGEKETVEKVMADHVSKFHESKAELILDFVNAAKSMAFAIAHGTQPRRRDARILVTQASQILGEPIPEMPEEEKTPATVADQPMSAGGSGEGASTQAGDASKSKSEGKK